MKIAALQLTINPNADDNRRHIEQQILKHADADLIVLPELHNAPYLCQQESTHNFDLAEPIPGPSTEWLGGLARQTQSVIVGSLFEYRGVGVYHNTAVVLDTDGSLAGSYRKTHLPDDPGYYEKYYFTPGENPIRPIQTSIGKLGVLVCWDQWYPEAARLMALAGADCLIYPTAIGWDPDDNEDERARQLEAWITVQRGHAVANNLPVISVNRCGFEPDPGAQTAGSQFWGNSFMVGPQAEWLCRAAEQETSLSAEIHTTRSAELRRIWPFFRDRRIDLYEDLCKRISDK